MSRAPRAAIGRHWGDDDSATPILHVDIDAFFASVELRERPELVGKPVAVGGKERGVVAAASYEARAFGVNSAMPVAQALRLCPSLIMITPTHGLYSTVSRRIMSILQTYSPRFEQVSIDEAFLDISSDKVHTPLQIARHLRWRIRAEERVPASVGIAATKHVAKIASAHAKPDGLLLIPAERTQEFLASLPLGAIGGVGNVSIRRLAARGLTDVKDILTLERADMVGILGITGGKIWDLAHGIDPRPVGEAREEKSIGKEETFFDLLHSEEAVVECLLDQAHECARRLRQRDLLAGRVTVKIRSSNFTTTTKSRTLTAPTNQAREIYRVARTLIKMPEGGVRLVGLRAERLQVAGMTQGLLGDDGKVDRAERTLESIQEKFGKGSASLGTLVPGRAYHRYDR